MKGLETCNLTINDINYLVCHQANIRIIEKIGEKLNLPKEKVLINVQKYGNTSSASIPILLSDYSEKKTFKEGDIIILIGFGAGFTWGINIIKWSNK